MLGEHRWPGKGALWGKVECWQSPATVPWLQATLHAGGLGPALDGGSEAHDRV